jgi:hypothetical protein
VSRFDFPKEKGGACIAVAATLSLGLSFEVLQFCLNSESMKT